MLAIADSFEFLEESLSTLSAAISVGFNFGQGIMRLDIFSFVSLNVFKSLRSKLSNIFLSHK